MIWAIVWKLKTWIAIAVLLLLWLGQIAYTNHLSGKLQKTETVCDVRIAKAIKPYQITIAKAEQQKVITEKMMKDVYEVDCRLVPIKGKACPVLVYEDLL